MQRRAQIPAFIYNKSNNDMLTAPLDTLFGMTIEKEPMKVDVVFDPTDSVVSIFVGPELFAPRKSLDILRTAAQKITNETSPVRGYEELFQCTRQFYENKRIVCVVVYTDLQNQFLATVPLHKDAEHNIRALLPWNGYCYEEGLDEICTKNLCVQYLPDHINMRKQANAGRGEASAPAHAAVLQSMETYQGAFEACLRLVSVFGNISKRENLLIKTNKLLSVFDTPTPPHDAKSDTTKHVDMLTYSSLALFGLLPLGILHMAMTQPCMHPDVVNALLPDVCNLFSNNRISSSNDHELFLILLVWNLHRHQATVQTYRSEQGEDQRRMVSLRSPENTFVVGDCEDLTSFTIQLVSTIFSVREHRAQVPLHLQQIGPTYRHQLLPGRGCFGEEIHAFPVLFEQDDAGCRLRVIESTQPVMCCASTADRDRAQAFFQLLPGGALMKYLTMDEVRKAYTVWFLGEYMVFVFTPSACENECRLEHMAKPCLDYLGPLVIPMEYSCNESPVQALHNLAAKPRVAQAHPAQTLVLIPEHIFLSAFEELCRYRPPENALPRDAACDSRIFGKHVELQRTLAPLLRVMFSESEEAHKILAVNLHKTPKPMPIPMCSLVIGVVQDCHKQTTCISQPLIPPPLIHPVRKKLSALLSYLEQVRFTLGLYMHYRLDSGCQAQLCPCIFAQAQKICEFKQFFTGWYASYFQYSFAYFEQFRAALAANAAGHVYRFDKGMCWHQDTLQDFLLHVQSFMHCVWRHYPGV